ncbi:MAG: hypothetical protein WA705_14290 [Candidatus Ozemobacteraceae bacterium]
MSARRLLPLGRLRRALVASFGFPLYDYSYHFNNARAVIVEAASCRFVTTRQDAASTLTPDY